MPSFERYRAQVLEWWKWGFRRRVRRGMKGCDMVQDAIMIRYEDERSYPESWYTIDIIEFKSPEKFLSRFLSPLHIPTA